MDLLFYGASQQPHKHNTENQSTMLNFQSSAQPTDQMDNIVPRMSVSPPPVPPLSSFIAALTIVMVIMWVSALPTKLSLAIVLFLYIIYVCLFWFVRERREFHIEMGQRFRNPENNQRLSGIADGFLWVLDERGRQAQQVSKKLFGSVLYFGSHGIPSGCSDCAICLDDFQKGEECLAFPVCSHVFHSSCIKDWLEWNMSCPICRYCILSPSTRIKGTRSSESLASIV